MDFMLNLQSPTAFLNAAAGAATGGAAGAAGLDRPDNDTSFSEVLAKAGGADQTAGAVDDTVQAENAADAAAAAEDAAGTAEAEDTADDGMVQVPKSTLEQISELIGNADDGVQKGLKLLFMTMMKALMGDSTKDKKTDLFGVLSGGNGLFDDDDLLLGAELMDQIGLAMELVSADEDDLTGALDRLLNSLLDEDETDENTAADILAAMLSPEIQDEIVMMAESENEELSSAKITAELFKLPKQIVLKEKPEAAPEMEKLFRDFQIEVVSKSEGKEDDIDIRGLMGQGRSAAKVNDAADQIRTIGKDEEVLPELAEVQNNWAADSTRETAPTEAEQFIARSVENQITERITEKLFDMKGDNDTGEMILILKPENLGQVAVKLIKENGALTVMLSAQYAETGRLMADRAAALSDSLTNRNVDVKDVRVVEPGSAAEQMGLDFTNQGFSFGRGQEYSSDGEKNSYTGIDGAYDMEETDVTDEAGHEINIIREAGTWQTTA